MNHKTLYHYTNTSVTICLHKYIYNTMSTGYIAVAMCYKYNFIICINCICMGKQYLLCMYDACTYVRIYVCMTRVHMYVRMYVCMYKNNCIYVCAFMYLYMFVCGKCFLSITLALFKMLVT